MNQIDDRELRYQQWIRRQFPQLRQQWENTPGEGLSAEDHARRQRETFKQAYAMLERL